MTLLNFVGFDPGGKGAFGWAVLSSTDGELTLTASGTCSNASDALREARLRCPSQPVAFAVDAPLFWVPAGDRKADVCVRKMVCAAGGFSGTVSAVNSLRGACVVQGIIVTRIASAVWPDSQISEAHPKALLAVCSEAKVFVATLGDQGRCEHKKDAAVAAFAAFKFAEKSAGWHDLAKSELNPFFPAGKPVAYWFPKARG